MASLALLFGFLTDVAMKATVVLIAAFILTALMRRASAASRHTVWIAACLALLALPMAKAALPLIPVPVLRAAPIATMTMAPSKAAMPTAPAAAAPAWIVDVTAEPVAIAASVAAIPVGQWSWSALVAVVWGAGAALLLTRAIVGFARIRRLRRASSPCADPRLLEHVHAAASTVGVGRAVRVIVGEAGAVPMTWGVVRPTILLPAHAIEWTDERLRSVVVHELAHVARLDAASQVIAQAAAMLLWCHPLMWVARRAIRLERERACDDVVLAHGVNAPRYAEDLLAVLQTSRVTSMAGTLAAVRRSQFARRVATILDARVNRGGRARAALAAGLALVLSALPLSAAHLVAKPSLISLAQGAIDITLETQAGSTPVAAPEAAVLPAPTQIAPSNGLRILSAVTGGFCNCGQVPLREQMQTAQTTMPVQAPIKTAGDLLDEVLYAQLSLERMTAQGPNQKASDLVWQLARVREAVLAAVTTRTASGSNLTMLQADVDALVQATKLLAVDRDRADVAAMTASTPRGYYEFGGAQRLQWPSYPVDFSGRWQPDDTKNSSLENSRANARFEVGVDRCCAEPAATVIVQTPLTLTVVRIEPRPTILEIDPEVYYLNGAPSSNGSGPSYTVDRSYPDCNGNAFVVSTSSNWKTAYSIENGELKIQRTWPDGHSISEYYKKAGTP